VCSDAISQEAVVSDHSKVPVGDVHDEGFYEISNGQCFLSIGFGVVVEEGEGNVCSVVGVDFCFGQRRFFQIFSEILDGLLGALLSFLKENVPCFLVMPVEPFVEGGQIAEVVFRFRVRLEFALFEGISQQGDDLVLPHVFYDLMVDCSSRDVLVGMRGRKASDRGAEVDVYVEFQVSAIGVDGQEDTREVMPSFFPLCADIEDDGCCDFWDFAYKVAVYPEKVPELSWHGEADVLIGNIWQRNQGLGDPVVGSSFAAGRTES